MPATIYHNLLLEFKKSCTKREAVARLLGWMTGPVYDDQDSAESSEGFLYESDLVYVNCLNDTLENTFLDLIETLQHELDEASANATDGVIKKKEAALNECIAKIYKVESYLIAIEEELCKGESSVLKIDQEATRKTGIPHIMLGSFDRWAREKYGITILQSTEPRSLNNNQLKNTKGSSSQNKGLGPAKSENLYATLAFLVDALSQLNTDYQSAGEPIVSTIAEYIEEVARNANNGEKLSGQSKEAIKDRIEEAIRVRKSILPIKR
jgi:hypothetical protein